MTAALRTTVRAATHLGTVRTENQDALYVGGWSTSVSGGELTADLPVGGVAAVIDGMGGHPGGAEASWTVSRLLGNLGLGSVRDPAELDSRIQQLSDALHAAAALTPSRATMGAAIAGAVHTETGLLVFNVGDCSILRVRDGYVGELGVIDRSPNGRLTQSLGGHREPIAIDAHSAVLDVRDGDIIILCSDGLTGALGAERILGTVGSSAEAELHHKLVLASLEAGATDNVSLATFTCRRP